MSRSLKTGRSLRFARAMANKLRDATVRVFPEKEKGRPHGVVAVAGTLDIDSTLARILVLVPRRYKSLRLAPPVVFCAEPWVRKGADWHNGPPLCWVLKDEWRDRMNWPGKRLAAFLTEGPQWLVTNVGSLLSRHFAAHCDGLTSWPASWPAWPHRGAGAREYRSLRRAATRVAEVRRQS